MSLLAVGPVFADLGDEVEAEAEAHDYLLALERGHGLTEAPAAPEPEVAAYDVLLERSPSVWVLVRKGDPVPRALRDRPRRCAPT